MAIILVPTNFATIQLAIAAAAPGDTIQVEAAYATAEIVSVTDNNLIFDGLTAQTGITLTLAAGITNLTMTGTTPFNAVDNAGNNTINGNAGNNSITVSSGLDTVDGGAGTGDVLVINYGADNGNFNMFSGNTFISDSTDTSVGFLNFERFNATFGSGNDTIVLGAGDDTLNGGGGNDSLNTAAGAAVVDGGAGGNDLWIADFSGDATVKTINLNLAGVQSAGNGSTYVNIERMSMTGGIGADVFTSRIGSPNDGFNDTLNGGAGNDTLTVGGGNDIVDGGNDDDLLTVNYATETAAVTTVGASFTDGSNTSVAFSNVERFDITTGSGNDNITTLGGTDVINAGTGIDTVNGGLGDDLLVINYSADLDSFSMNGPAIITDFNNTSVSFSNIERFNATFGSGNDTIVLLGGNDIINGGGGNDSLNTAAGAAVIDGGVGGNDLWIADFSGDATAKNINLNLAGIQAAGNGTTYVNIERMTINGGAGNDVLTSRTGNANDGFIDTLNGGVGDDTLTVGGGLDVVDGGAGGGDVLVIDYSTDSGAFFMNGPAIITDFNNTSVSFTNVERFNATFGSGNDVIVLLGGNDVINGGGGGDSLNTAAGAAVVDGGTGDDLWIADFSGDATAKSINLNLAGIQAAGNGTTYVNIERMNINGGAGNDFLTSRTGNPNDGFNDTLNGGTGSDTLTVGGGLDIVDGGIGGDDLLVIDYSADISAFFMNGVAQISDFTNTNVSFSNIERFNATFGSGNDVIVLLGGNDVINGGGGDDSLNTAAGAAVVDGGVGGIDLWIADFSGDASVKNINLNLAGIQAAGNGTTYVNIERMTINGGAGNDILTSRTSNANDGFVDTLNGGAGNDTLTVGGGHDSVDGGVGGDDLLVIDYSTDAGAFSMNGVAQINDFNNTSISFTNIERFNATFGSGNDIIVLLGGNDIINGGGGNDSLNTAAGAAVVDGGSGDDLWIADFSGDATAKNINLNLAGVQAAGNGTTYVNIERMNIIGGAGNDFLTSRTSNANDGFADTLNGGAGDDTLTVGGGADSVDGGLGGDDLLIIDYSTDASAFFMNGAAQINDFTNTSVSFTNIERFNATFGSGNDNITLLNGNDILTGGNGADVLNGAGGNDLFIATAALDGGDTYNGSSGFDTANYAALAALNAISVTLNGGSAVTLIVAGGNNDQISGIENVIGGAGDDSITGDANFNELVGNAGADTLNGGTGNDVLNGGAGDDVMDGGADFDTVDYTAAAFAISINLNVAAQANTGGLGTDTLSNIENVLGGAFADTLIGTAGVNELYGGAGGDILDGGAGNDRLDGGADSDTVDYSAAASALYIDLRVLTQTNTGGLGTDIISSIENIIGGGFNDSLIGNASVNTFYGGAGADSVYTEEGDDFAYGGAGVDYVLGRLGNDTLFGGDDNDTLDGGAGTDALSGEAGDDFILGGDANDIIHGGDAGASVGDTADRWLGGDAGDDTIYGGLGNDRMDGGTGNDSLYGGEARDYVTAGSGNDTLYGGSEVGAGDIWLSGEAGTDTIFGEDGNDVLDGGADNDLLYGGNGLDTLYGGAGNDLIEGGAGTDGLFGGTGLDIFDYNLGAGTDNIYDFTNDVDTLQVDAAYGLTAAQVFAAASIFGNHAYINLGGGNGMILLNWISGGNTIAQLGDDILIA